MLYRLVCFILFIGSRIFYRVKVSGAEHIPAEGAFILCSNHIHSYDPAIIATSIKRQLRFMAKKELFRNRVKGGFFRAMGAFPVDRNAADIASYRNAMKALKSGMGLLIFSQGTRMRKLDIKGAKGGAALFALKAQVPIVPAGIESEYKFRRPLNLRYGKPISMEKYAGRRINSDLLDEVMAEVMAEIAILSNAPLEKDEQNGGTE